MQAGLGSFSVFARACVRVWPHAHVAPVFCDFACLHWGLVSHMSVYRGDVVTAASWKNGMQVLDGMPQAWSRA